MFLKQITRAAAAAMLCIAGTASAAVVTLTFEGIGSGARIENFYNGGTDSAGNQGTNYGVRFGNAALAIVDADAGGTGNIGNEPSPSTVMYFLSGSAILNYAAGFTDGFSFYYSATFNPGFVNVYDGEDGTGNLLGTINLPTTAACAPGGSDPGDFCTWMVGSLAFAGTAKSIDFGGTANQIAFDNVTFGATTPGGTVPEPASLGLVGAALLGLAAASRRRA